MAQVLASSGTGDPSGSIYLYGLGRIAQETPTQREYYLGDALGSVRQLVDATGQVQLARSYAPFGGVLSSAGEAARSYAFTGEWSEPTGLIYLRARYYDPATGRFLSKDPVRGLASLPQTLNPYVYGNNNPLRYIDPDGRFPILPLIALAGAFIFFSQIPSDQYQADPNNWGNPGVQLFGLALMSPACTPLPSSNFTQLWNVLKLRWAYESAVRALRSEALQKLVSGESYETVARWAHGARRLLGNTYKGMTPPELLEIITARNIQK